MVMEKYWNKCCADYHPCLAIIHLKWDIGNSLHISVATKKSVQGYFDLLRFTVWDLIDFSVWFPLESVYDLLPKELQLPSSREQNAAAMSQKSGGEAGPPPSTALAEGKLCFRILNHLFSQMLKTGAKACIVMHIHLPTCFVVDSFGSRKMVFIWQVVWGEGVVTSEESRFRGGASFW